MSDKDDVLVIALVAVVRGKGVGAKSMVNVIPYWDFDLDLLITKLLGISFDDLLGMNPNVLARILITKLDSQRE